MGRGIKSFALRALIFTQRLRSERLSKIRKLYWIEGTFDDKGNPVMSIYRRKYTRHGILGKKEFIKSFGSFQEAQDYIFEISERYLRILENNYKFVI